MNILYHRSKISVSFLLSFLEADPFFLLLTFQSLLGVAVNNIEHKDKCILKTGENTDMQIPDSCPFDHSSFVSSESEIGIRAHKPRM
jgi:hypothetical protein